MKVSEHAWLWTEPEELNFDESAIDQAMRETATGWKAIVTNDDGVTATVEVERIDYGRYYANVTLDYEGGALAQAGAEIDDVGEWRRVLRTAIAFALQTIERVVRDDPAFRWWPPERREAIKRLGRYVDEDLAEA